MVRHSSISNVLSDGNIQQTFSRVSMQKKRDSFARDENTAGNLSPFAKAPQPCCNQILVVDDNTFNVTSLTLIMKHCFNLDCDKVRNLKSNFK